MIAVFLCGLLVGWVARARAGRHHAPRAVRLLPAAPVYAGANVAELERVFAARVSADQVRVLGYERPPPTGIPGPGDRSPR